MVYFSESVGKHSSNFYCSFNIKDRRSAGSTINVLLKTHRIFPGKKVWRFLCRMSDFKLLKMVNNVLHMHCAAFQIIPTHVPTITKTWFDKRGLDPGTRWHKYCLAWWVLLTSMHATYNSHIMIRSAPGRRVYKIWHYLILEKSFICL